MLTLYVGDFAMVALCANPAVEVCVEITDYYYGGNTPTHEAIGDMAWFDCNCV
jgi:hypothetical protein